MARLPNLVPLIGSMLLSRGGRRIAGRHAGKLALATMAYQLWRNYSDKNRPAVSPAPSAPPSQPPVRGASSSRRNRWSGRNRH